MIRVDYREAARSMKKYLRKTAANMAPQVGAAFYKTQSQSVRKDMLAARRQAQLARAGTLIRGVVKGKVVPITMTDEERAYINRGLQADSQESQRRLRRIRYAAFPTTIDLREPPSADYYVQLPSRSGDAARLVVGPTIKEGATIIGGSLCMDEPSFKLGDVVSWTSSNTPKKGTIIAVVPAGKTPADVGFAKAGGGGGARDHESYIVKGGPVGDKTSNKPYWPVVSLLRHW